MVRNLANLHSLVNRLFFVSEYVCHQVFLRDGLTEGVGCLHTDLFSEQKSFSVVCPQQSVAL